jgi:hypothetical protein
MEVAMSRPMVLVFTAQGEIESEQVRAFLEANEITTMEQGEALRKTHGMVLDGLGEVRILVPADQEEDARELLKRVEQGELALPDDFEQ